MNKIPRTRVQASPAEPRLLQASRDLSLQNLSPCPFLSLNDTSENIESVDGRNERQKEVHGGPYQEKIASMEPTNRSGPTFPNRHHFALETLLRLTSLSNLILMPRIRENGPIRARRTTFQDGKGRHRSMVAVTKKESWENIGHVL